MPESRVSDTSPASRTSAVSIASSVLIVIAATLVAHWPVLDANAILFDDFEYVQQNPLVQNPSWHAASRFLGEVLAPSTVGGYYQPLSMISLMLDCAMGAGPANYRLFHRTSLALHAACAVLVMLLAHALFKNRLASIAAGLLFGLHPGSVESIAWVSDRKTLLASFFALLCMWFYVRYTRAAAKARLRFIACIALYILALLSKPTVLLIPLVLILLDLWPLNRFSKTTIVEKIPLLALAAIFAVITFISQAATANVASPRSYPVWAAPLILCHNHIFYLSKIFWPVALSPYYPWPEPFNLSQPSVQLGLAGTVLLLVLLIAIWRRSRGPACAWLMFLVILLPAMGLIGFTSAIAADRFAYLPKVFLLLGVSAFFTRLMRDNNKPRANEPRALASVFSLQRCFVAALTLALAALETSASRSYLAKWTDTQQLFQHMIAVAPNSAYLHSNFGNVLQGAGKREQAMLEYQEALRLGEDPVAHGGLAVILADIGRLDEAERHLRESYRLYPKNVQILENLGIVLDRLGKWSESEEFYRRALQMKPDSPTTLHSYGVSLFRNRRWDDAADRFAAAVRLNPNLAPTYYQWGCLHMVRGDPEKALHVWREGLQTSPDDFQLLSALSWLLATADNPSFRNGTDAVQLAQRAVSISRAQDAAILDTLAAAFAETGRFEDAISAAQESIRLWTAAAQPQQAVAVQGRLEGYQAHRPYHEIVRPERYLPR